VIKSAAEGKKREAGRGSEPGGRIYGRRIRKARNGEPGFPDQGNLHPLSAIPWNLPAGNSRGGRRGKDFVPAMISRDRRSGWSASRKAREISIRSGFALFAMALAGAELEFKLGMTVGFMA